METSKARKTRLWRRRSSRFSVLRGATLLTTVIGLAAATACGGSTSDPQPGAAGGATLPTVSIGLVAPDASNSVVRLAQKAGLFEKNGVNADVKVIPPASLRPGVISGSIQFASFGGPSAEILKLQGAPISYLASYAQTATTQAVVRPGIASPADLKGKPVGTTGPGTQGELFMALLLARGGLTLADVQEVKMPDVQNLVSAFQAGTINAITSSPPLSTTVLANNPGSTVAIDFRKEKFAWPNNQLVGNAQYVKDHPDVTTKVITAILQAIPLYEAQPDLAKQNIQEENGNTLSPAALDASYALGVGLFTQNAVTTPELERSVIDAIHKMGGDYANLGKPSDADTMMDTQYVQDAMNQLKAG